MISAFPLTLLPLVVFNLIGFAYGGTPWTTEVFRVPMVSGVDWTMTLGDVIVLFGLVMLFFEMLKAARPAPRTIANHLASTAVLIVYVVEFVLAGAAANATFFLLTVIALFDVAAGFTISIRTASRDIALGGAIDGPA